MVQDHKYVLFVAFEKNSRFIFLYGYISLCEVEPLDRLWIVCVIGGFPSSPWLNRAKLSPDTWTNSLCLPSPIHEGHIPVQIFAGRFKMEFLPPV